MTPTGHGVIRGRRDLLYDLKGHGDLCRRFNLTYDLNLDPKVKHLTWQVTTDVQVTL